MQIVPQTGNAAHFPSTAAADRDSIAELRERLRNVALERDGFEQELYEINRHAAWLARERQHLLGHRAVDRLSFAARETELLGQIETARTAMARAEETAHHQADDLELLRAESARRQAQIDMLSRRLDDLERSLSWKLTAPFRDWTRRLTGKAVR